MAMAVTEGIGYTKGDRKGGNKLEFIDVRRAYFHARARRLVYVKLPIEDQEDGKCGRLNKAMYGTRDAAQNWECEYVQFMEDIGFKRGQSTPCIFWHKGNGIRAVIHGDDFTLMGNEAALNWFRSKIQEKFEVKFRGRLGPEEKDDKAIRILNRVVTWDEHGIKYEADQRHAEIIVRRLGLTEMSNSVVTPGVKGNESGRERRGGWIARKHRCIGQSLRGPIIYVKTGPTFNLQSKSCAGQWRIPLITIGWHSRGWGDIWWEGTEWRSGLGIRVK
jgi:hypothetical protein